jgi:hypothetical protein
VRHHGSEVRLERTYFRAVGIIDAQRTLWQLRLLPAEDILGFSGFRV